MANMIKPPQQPISSALVAPRFRSLWSDLVSLYPINENKRDLYDIIAQTSLDSTGTLLGDLQPSPTKMGKGIVVGSDTGIDISLSSTSYPFQSGGTQLTSASLIRPDDDPDWYGCFFSTAGTNTSGIRLLIEPNGTMRFRTVTSGASHNLNITTTSFPWSYGDYILSVARFDAGYKFLTLHNYNTGVTYTGTSGPTTPTSLNHEGTAIGENGQDGNGFVGAILYVAGWDRRLTDAEVDLLVGDPYGLFAPAKVIYPVLPSGYGEEVVDLTHALEGFRWRNDDGTEATATWAANQDVTYSIAEDGTIRLRVLIKAPEGGQYQLEISENTVSDWHAVTT